MNNIGFKFIPNTSIKDVWCPTTESGTWLAHDGKRDFLTGNSTSNISLQNINSSKEFRSCFVHNDTEDHVFYSSDLSSAELFLLGHYLKDFDNGEFLEAVVHGKKEDKTDIHNVNARKGNVTRNDAKVLIYSILYGASPILIGHNLWSDEIYHKMINKVTYEEYLEIYEYLEKRAIIKDSQKFIRIKKDLWKHLNDIAVYKFIYGKRMQDSFIAGFTGLKELQNELQRLYNEDGGITIGVNKKIWFKDGRTALNYLLQGSNAHITKLWVFYTSETARRQGLKIPNDYSPLTIVHDEINLSIKKQYATILKTGIEKANKVLGYKYPITADSFTYDNWSMH